MQVKFHLPVCCLVPRHVSGQLECLRFHSSHHMKRFTLAGKLGLLHVHLSSVLCKGPGNNGPQNQAVTHPKAQAAGSHGK